MCLQPSIKMVYFAEVSAEILSPRQSLMKSNGWRV